METILRAKGLRPTPHRLQIAKRVLQCHVHVTVEQMQEWAASLNKPISRASVYNILNEFVAVGLLKAFHSSALGKTIYDSNTEKHFHLYDLDTEVVTDLDPELVQIKTSALRNYRVEEIEVMFKARKKISP